MLIFVYLVKKTTMESRKKAMETNPYKYGSPNWILWENCIESIIEGYYRVLKRGEESINMKKHHLPTKEQMVNSFQCLMYMELWP